MTEERLKLFEKAETRINAIIDTLSQDKGGLAEKLKQEDVKDFLISLWVDCATENGVQWHDLRKDPNDLPYTEINDTERKVIVMRENDIIDFDKYFKSWGWQKEVLRRTMDKVIAWCEIPQFKE